MTDSVDALVALLNLEQIEPDLYRGMWTHTARQRTYGGLVLAQSVSAAYRTVPAGRTLHSLHANFLEAGRADTPILYEVETVRDGGSISVRRIVARQGGVRIFMLTCSFHIAETGLEHSDPMPQVPGPDECRPATEVVRERYGRRAAQFWDEWRELDVRFVGETEEVMPVSHAAHLRAWVRTMSPLPDDHVVHEATLAYLSDLTLLSVSAIGHPIMFGSPDMEAASLDHAMWFHRPFRADEWLLYDQVSPSASGARGFSLGRIFQGGRLVATAAQEGLIRLT